MLTINDTNNSNIQQTTRTSTASHFQLPPENSDRMKHENSFSSRGNSFFFVASGTGFRLMWWVLFILFSFLRAQVNLSRHRATSYSGQPRPDAIKKRWTAKWTGVATVPFLDYLSKLFHLKTSCNIERDRKTTMNFEDVIIWREAFIAYLTKLSIKYCEMNEKPHKIIGPFFIVSELGSRNEWTYRYPRLPTTYHLSACFLPFQILFTCIIINDKHLNNRPNRLIDFHAIFVPFRLIPVFLCFELLLAQKDKIVQCRRDKIAGQT